MRIVGRTLLHAAAVGVAAGLAGAGFFVVLEYFSTFTLEWLARYTPLRADGETFAASALPVLSDDGRLLCLVGESELTGRYLRRAAAAEREAVSMRGR